MGIGVVGICGGRRGGVGGGGAPTLVMSAVAGAIVFLVVAVVAAATTRALPGFITTRLGCKRTRLQSNTTLTAPALTIHSLTAPARRTLALMAPLIKKTSPTNRSTEALLSTD